MSANGKLGLLGEVENEQSSNMVWVWVDSSSTIISTRMGSAQRLYPWVRLSDYMGDFGIDPPEDWVTVRLSSQLSLQIVRDVIVVTKTGLLKSAMKPNRN